MPSRPKPDRGGLRAVPDVGGSVPRAPNAPRLPPPTLDDSQLLASIREGDPDAASALHDRLRPVVERSIRRILGRQDRDHEDLAQQAMIQVVFTVDRFRGDCPLDAWASTVAAHVVYNHLRRRTTERKLFESLRGGDDDAPASSVSFARETAARSELRHVLRHLDAIDEAKAWTYVLHDVCGYDLREVAQITESSVAAAQVAARSRTQRAPSAARRRPRARRVAFERREWEGVMTIDPLDRATAMLRDSVADHGDVEAMPPNRDIAVARIADALRERARARRRRRWYGALAAAAAVVLLAGGGVLLAKRGAGLEAARGADLGRMSDPHGAVTALRDGRPEPLSQGARVVEGTELVTTAASEAHLDFDSGSRVTLGGAARVRLVEQSSKKRFSISAGALTAKVAKLGANERFVVTTPDAEIEVRGTLFRVSIVAPDPSCEAGTPTRLYVDEGVVVVRHAGVEERVAAGGRWPACGALPTASIPTTNAPVAASTTVAPVATHSHAPTTPHGVHPPPDSSSRLAEQNDLFDDAMRAKRAGDFAGALAKLDRLRAAYPGGPLAENAEVERMRVLAATSRPRAADAARDYLRRRPHGFARAEAEALAAAAP